jgi:hypothetical protein
MVCSVDQPPQGLVVLRGPPHLPGLLCDFWKVTRAVIDSVVLEPRYIKVNLSIRVFDIH